jgi:hypothetical protein
MDEPTILPVTAVTAVTARDEREGSFLHVIINFAEDVI